MLLNGFISAKDEAQATFFLSPQREGSCDTGGSSLYKPLESWQTCVGLKCELIQRKLNTLTGNYLMLQWRGKAVTAPWSGSYVDSGLCCMDQD